MQTSRESPWWSESWPWLGFILLVLATRLFMVAFFGNDMPFQDEWAREAHQLFEPFLKGSLRLTDMFTVWVQHRIFTTQVYELLMLGLDGNVWSPIQQMVGNSLLQGLTFAGITALLMRACPRPDRRAFYFLALCLFGLPLAMGNVLVGFQTQFYLCIGFSCIFLWSVIEAKPFSLWWLSGMVCGLLGLFSMGPGGMALLCGAAFLVIRCFFMGGGRSDLLVAAALMTPALLAIAQNPPIYQDLAHTPLEFASAFAQASSWPALPGMAVILYFPFVRFCWQKLSRIRQTTTAEWFVLLLGAWVILQILSVAYLRSRSPLVSRYFDVYVVGLVINGLCLLVQERRRSEQPTANAESEGKSASCLPLAQVWILTIGLGLVYNLIQLEHELKIKKAWESRPLSSVQGYLRTHDFGYLQGKNYPDIPYENDRELKSMLDDPSLVAILPPILVPENAARQPFLLRAMVNHLSVLVVLGFAAGTACVGMSFRRGVRSGKGEA